MPCPQLWALQDEISLSGASLDLCLHHFCFVPDDHDMSVNSGFFQGIENKMDHRPADDGAQNLREVAFHASPLPRLPGPLHKLLSYESIRFWNRKSGRKSDHDGDNPAL